MSVSWLANLKQRYFKFVDWVDARIDKPAKDRGTFTSGSEQMIDDPMAKEKGVPSRIGGQGSGAGGSRTELGG
jgi:hypothetical protein